MHIFSIANTLARLEINCAVCVPNDAGTIQQHGAPQFDVVTYSEAMRDGVRFEDGRGPDLIHAWTPRELVRKLTERLVELHGCPYIVHLEDNERFIVEAESNGLKFDDLAKLPLPDLDAFIPEHRSHPVRSKSFLEGAAALTVLIDRLLEFKPQGVPAIVFWPGFDEAFLNPPPPSPSLFRRIAIQPGEKVLVYNGNVHESNAAEVHSLFLGVQALRRAGLTIRLLKTGWNYVEDKRWIEEAIDCGAVSDLGFLPRSELASLLSLASVLVQPGRADDFNEYRFPSKVPEFFASGKPVIIPNCNIGRFVRDNIDAVLLQHGDALEIAHHVERLLNDPKTAEEIGQAGRAFALRRLVWKNNVPPIRDLYVEVLNRRRHSAGPVTNQPSGLTGAPVKLVAFFLPQFHPIQENDRFWGKGFTEWTNVAEARPSFEGHYQPQVPADLGFYDLRLTEVLESQASLARSYGIYGFCFYYYWFNGRRLLDLPLEQMLRTGRPNIPFCICWANENWTRSWDGSENEILIRQDYSGDACTRFIREIIPMLRRPEYIKVDGAPVLLVYRVNLLPNAAVIARMWREICRDEGIPDIHLCSVQSFGVDDPRPYGFDAAVEFPPHTGRALLDHRSFPGIHADFEGYLEDYPTVVRNQLSAPAAEYIRYRGVMPAWDNTPRRGRRAHILVNSSPEQYESWLCELVKEAMARRDTQQPLVFINAWNEWAEGAYLEPDKKHGSARLRATLNALRRGIEPYELSLGSNAATPAPPVAEQQSSDRDRAGSNHLAKSYRLFDVKALGYGTVRDYCDSFENINALATANGDLKDCQRPWILKAILAKVPPPARVLEIGAGKPLVADLLHSLGYEVCIVDPYDGSGNGPRQYEEFRQRYPHLRFVRSQFDDRLTQIEDETFDCIYSISVLEHVPADLFPGMFTAMRKHLQPNGVCVHAIDHVSRGARAEEHLMNLRIMTRGFGFSQAELDGMLETMSTDTDTYYLSAESHNRWRAGVPYAEFPMRICVSIQIVVQAQSLRIP